MPTLTVTPTGSLSLPFSKLAALIAQSTTFQTACGVGSNTAALPFIDYPHWSTDNTGTPDFQVPGCIITDDDELMQRRDIHGSEEGELIVVFALAPNPADNGNDKDAEIRFRNTIGAILDEMLTLANDSDGNDGHNLDLTGWTKVITPQRSNPDEYEDDFFFAGFVLGWR